MAVYGKVSCSIKGCTSIEPFADQMEEVDRCIDGLMNALGYPSDTENFDVENPTFRNHVVARELLGNIMFKFPDKKIQVDMKGDKYRIFVAIKYPGIDRFDRHLRASETTEMFTQITGHEYVDKTYVSQLQDEQKGREGSHAGIGCFVAESYSDGSRTKLDRKRRETQVRYLIKKFT